jgi:glycosyltransferase involved in cell wall biosynthesis
MSSAWEGLPIAVLEAMGGGLPSVVTDAGGNRELVDNGENGLIVPVKDPFALSDGLFRLIVDRDLRKKFSASAKAKAEAFSIRECARRHISLYEGVTFKENGKNDG